MTDLRLFLRSLARRPLFTILLVVTLAVGVGATTATFTYLASFFWDNVTPDPESLVQIRYRDPDEPAFPLPVSYLDFQDYRREAADVGLVTAWWIWGQGVRTAADEAAWAWGHSVSDGYLQTLRAEPAVGRLLVAEDHQPGATRAVVLGHRFWRRHYDLAPDTIGRALLIGGERYVIVGVTRESFIGSGIPADLYIPIQYTRDGAPEWDGTARDSSQLFGGRVWSMARLAPGVTREQAEARFTAIAGELDRHHPRGGGRKRELALVDIDDNGNAELFLAGAWRLFGAAGLLLLLANANVANLLLARYLDRRRDLSVLAALGASVRRIVTQLVLESAFIALLGAALGVVFSRVLVAVLRRILVVNPVDLAQWGEGAEGSYLALDWRIVLFAFAVSLATALVFGVLPAAHAARVDLAGALRQTGTGTDRAGGRARTTLVAVQVALAVALVVGAGLLVRGLRNVWSVDPGFAIDHLAIATLAIAHEGGDEPDLRASFEEAGVRASAIPGIEAAALTDTVPLWGYRTTDIAIPGRDEPVESIHTVVGRGYFETLRQPILRGRAFELGDARDAPPVAIVNQELARELWPESDPVGQSLALDIPRLRVAGEVRVVGVVADVRTSLRGAARPQLYLPTAQVPRIRMSVLLRTSVEPEASLASVRDALSRAHPQLAVVNVATFEEHLESTLFEERLYATMGGITAALGLALAATGIYSVLAYVVRARNRETAIRMAMGATPRDVVAGTMREAARPVVIGVVVGVAGAIAGTRLLRAMLYGVDALDPLMLAAAPAVVLLCAALAGLGPSVRASRTDPMTVLREE